MIHRWLRFYDNCIYVTTLRFAACNGQVEIKFKDLSRRVKECGWLELLGQLQVGFIIIGTVEIELKTNKQFDEHVI